MLKQKQCGRKLNQQSQLTKDNKTEYGREWVADAKPMPQAAQRQKVNHHSNSKKTPEQQRRPTKEKLNNS